MYQVSHRGTSVLNDDKNDMFNIYIVFFIYKSEISITEVNTRILHIGNDLQHLNKIGTLKTTIYTFILLLRHLYCFYSTPMIKHTVGVE